MTAITLEKRNTWKKSTEGFNVQRDPFAGANLPPRPSSQGNSQSATPVSSQISSQGVTKSDLTAMESQLKESLKSSKTIETNPIEEIVEFAGRVAEHVVERVCDALDSIASFFR